MSWKIYAWNKATKKWGLVGETEHDEAAELAIRTVAAEGHVSKAEREHEEMRATPLSFYRIRYLGDGRDRA